MVLLVRNETLLAKTESTYNTDSSPGGTDAVAFSGLSWQNEGLRFAERNVVKAGLDTSQRIYGGRLQTITFTCELKGSGAAGTGPEIDPLLKACGMGATVVASTSVTYAPASSSLSSCTIYYYEEGVRYVLTGCRGTCSFDFTVGQVPTVTFTMTGHTANPTDNSAPSATFDSTTPLTLINIPFTWGGTNLVINQFTMDVGNVVATPPSMSATDGYGDVSITGRSPNGTVDPEAVLVATDDAIADLTGGVTKAVSIGAIGASAGNIIDLDLPAAYYVDATPGEREGIRTKQFNYAAAISSGDDEWSLVYT